MIYFDYCTGLTMTNERFDKLFGGPAAQAGRVADPASHGSCGLDPGGDRGSRAAAYAPLASETGIANLCLAGGVALNCVANGKVLRDGRFDDIWIQPAAGDAGGALGAALAAYASSCRDQPRKINGRTA